MFGLFRKKTEKEEAPRAVDRALTYEDTELAVPEIHVNRFAEDMEYVEEILEEEEKEKEAFVETENLAFPEIHLSKIKKRK